MRNEESHREGYMQADGQSPPDCCTEPGTDPGRPAVPGYAWMDCGLYRIKRATKDTDSDRFILIAPPFSISGLCCSENGKGWAMLIEWQDRKNHSHSTAIPFKDLKGDGSHVFDALADGGMSVPPEIALRKELLAYLCKAQELVRNQILSVNSLGWHKGAFLLPMGEVIGNPTQMVRFAGNSNHSHTRKNGTLQGWQQNVAKYGSGNPYLAFSLCVPFAAPLLYLFNNDGGGSICLAIRARVRVPAPRRQQAYGGL